MVFHLEHEAGTLRPGIFETGISMNEMARFLSEQSDEKCECRKLTARDEGLFINPFLSYLQNRNHPCLFL
jgi:hypothetical protein